MTLEQGNIINLILILSGAFILDFIFGDPKSKFHPIVLLGNYIKFSEKISRRLFNNDYLGGVFCVSMVSLSIICVILILMFLLRDFLLLQLFFSMVIIWSCIAIKSLVEHGLDVIKGLNKSLKKGRLAVSMLVSRETKNMSKEEVIRATIESLSENFIDSIASPIFWFIVGYFLHSIYLAIALILLLRIVNTFDAMIGYRTEKYLKFGFFAAKFDDILHFIPARITPIAVGSTVFFMNKLSSKFLIKTIKVAYRDGHKHASPNSCYGMAAFAGALGIRLGGATKYNTGIKMYPYWGDDSTKLSISHIEKACALIIYATFFFCVLNITLILLLI